jgi:hypothetical protein
MKVCFMILKQYLFYGMNVVDIFLIKMANLYEVLLVESSSTFYLPVSLVINCLIPPPNDGKPETTGNKQSPHS